MVKVRLWSEENRHRPESDGVVSGRSADGKWIVDLQTPFAGYAYHRPGVIDRVALEIRYEGDRMGDHPRTWPSRVNAFLPRGGDFGGSDWELIDVLELMVLDPEFTGEPPGFENARPTGLARLKHMVQRAFSRRS